MPVYVLFKWRFALQSSAKFLIIICCITSCNIFNNPPISIRKIYPYPNAKEIDTIWINNKPNYVLFENFIISNYKDQKKTEHVIDSFILSGRPVGWSSFYQYAMSFYKESKYTNEAYLKMYPREFDRYSNQHDIVYTYEWRKGKLLYKWKYKNGKIINDNVNPADLKIRLSDSVNTENKNDQF